jgi:prepilin-type N-terminal cleavage/methylation domain-containing protein
MRDNKGFTLIELLIVVVIIGILAAIAIPKFGATREQAYVSQMKSDLRNLQSAQELYYSTNAYTYAAATTDLGTDWSPSEGVNVSLSQAGDGWTATATHNNATGWTCAVFVNTDTGPSPATTEGAVACNDGGS